MDTKLTKNKILKDLEKNHIYNGYAINGIANNEENSLENGQISKQNECSSAENIALNKENSINNIE